MATTLADLQLRLAYRLAEDSAPTDTNEKNRRTSFLNEGYKKVLGEHYWWFLRRIAAQSSAEDQEIYILPSDFRDIIELRYNRKLCTFIPLEDATGTYNYPPTYYAYRSIAQRFYIYGDQELHMLPETGETAETFSVSSLTRSGTTATAAIASHGLRVGDFILISGASEADYNGSHMVTSVTENDLTFTVSNSPSTPATGTITAQWQNIVYRYYTYPSLLSSDADTIVIPEQFSDVLVAYAFGRYGYIDDLRANAADGFEEYNQILKDLISEHNRRSLYEKPAPGRSPVEFIE